MEYKMILHDIVYKNNEFIDVPIDITKQVSIGTSVLERFAEELDIGRLTITHSYRKREFNMFSLIELTMSKNNEEIKTYDLIIENDKVTPINKKGKTLYKHELRLIELTHLLDQSLINTLSFTQPLLGRYLAPFEQEFELYYDPQFKWKSLDMETEVTMFNEEAHKYTVVIDKPEIMNRYEGYVKIPKINKAKLQYTDGEDQESGISQYMVEEDILLTIFAINEDSFGNYNETFLPQHNTIISDIPFSKKLEPGRYRVELRAEGEVDIDFFAEDSQYTFIPFWGTNIKMIRRILSFYISVEKEPYSMYDIIKRIQLTSPISKMSMLGATRKFEIDEELKSRLEKIKAPQMLIKELTTREGLNEALKYVNSVCRLVKSNTTYKIVENHFNTRKEMYDIGKIFGFGSEKNTLEYSTSLRSYLKRTISNNSNDTPSIKTPSAKDFEGYRSETLQILPDTTKIFLSEPIFRIVKVTARIRYDLNFAHNAWFPRREEINNYEIDLTPRVLEKKEFSLRRKKVFLTSTSILDRVSHPRKSFLRDTQGEFATYDYLGKEIDFTSKSVNLVGFFAQPYFVYILTSALYEEMVFMMGRHATDFGIEPNVGTAYDTYENTYACIPAYEDYASRFYSYTGEPVIEQILSLDEQRLSNIELRVEYITMSNTIQSSQRENTDTIFIDTVKKINQNTKITNFERTTKQGYGFAQRYGVPTINFSKLTKYPQILPEPGDFNANNEVIVEKGITLHKNHVIAEFEASKDFNRFSKYVGLDREYRHSEIPEANLSEERLEIYEEFLEYYTGSEPYEIENDTYITNLFTETMINTLVQDPSKNTLGISNVLIRTDGTVANYPDSENSKKYITIPTVSMGGKNILSFGFRFNDSRIAGDIVDFNNIFGILENPYGLWQEFVEYTKTDGTFDTLDFNFVNAIPNEQTDIPYYRTRKLPLVDYNSATALYQMDAITFASTDNEGFENPLMIYKDQSERFGLVYQISFVPKNKEARESLIFGTNFTTYNFLVNGNEEEKYLYVYNDGTEYFKFDDQKIKHGFVSKINLKSVELNTSIIYVNGMAVGISVTLPAGTTSWALGNNNEDLDIANNTPNNKIFFIPRNQRRDVRSSPSHLYLKISALELPLSISFEMGTTKGVVLSVDLELPLQVEFEMGTTKATALSVELELPTQVEFEMGTTKGVVLSVDLELPLQVEFEMGTTKAIVLSVELELPTQVEFEMGTTNAPVLSVELELPLQIEYEVFTEKITENNIALILPLQISYEMTTVKDTELTPLYPPLHETPSTQKGTDFIEIHYENDNAVAVILEVDIPAISKLPDETQDIVIQSNTTGFATFSGLSASTTYTIRARYQPNTGVTGYEQSTYLETNITTNSSSPPPVDPPPEEPEITATFDSDGGTSVDSQSGASPLTVTAPDPAPTKTDNNLTGWLPELPADIETNTTFTAQWVLVEGTLINVFCHNFNLHGKYADGEGGSYNELIEENNVETCGYEEPPPGDVTASFNTNGGSPNYNSITGTPPLSVSNPGSPTKSGYDFLGWSPTLPTSISSNQVFQAIWTEEEEEPVEVMATFDSDGGTPNYSSITGLSPLTVNSPGSVSKDAHQFNGWSPSLPRDITTNTTFKATWLVAGCLEETTPIIMADGSTKLIKDIEVGEMLKGWYKDGMVDESDPDWEDWTTQDVEDGLHVPVEVKFVQKGTYGLYYTLNDDIKITPYHTMLVKKDNTWQWLDAPDIAVGDFLLGMNNNPIEVTSITAHQDTLNIVKLDVESVDTYFAGETPIVVHNETIWKEPT